MSERKYHNHARGWNSDGTCPICDAAEPTRPPTPPLLYADVGGYRCPACKMPMGSVLSCLPDCPIRKCVAINLKSDFGIDIDATSAGAAPKDQPRVTYPCGCSDWASVSNGKCPAHGAPKDQLPARDEEQTPEAVLAADRLLMRWLELDMEELTDSARDRKKRTALIDALALYAGSRLDAVSGAPKGEDSPKCPVCNSANREAHGWRPIVFGREYEERPYRLGKVPAEIKHVERCQNPWHRAEGEDSAPARPFAFYSHNGHGKYAVFVCGKGVDIFCGYEKSEDAAKNTVDCLTEMANEWAARAEASLSRAMDLLRRIHAFYAQEPGAENCWAEIRALLTEEKPPREEKL